jgi:hypothetical protein
MNYNCLLIWVTAASAVLHLVAIIFIFKKNDSFAKATKGDVTKLFEGSEKTQEEANKLRQILIDTLKESDDFKRNLAIYNEQSDILDALNKVKSGVNNIFIRFNHKIRLPKNFSDRNEVSKIEAQSREKQVKFGELKAEVQENLFLLRNNMHLIKFTETLNKLLSEAEMFLDFISKNSEELVLRNQLQLINQLHLESANRLINERVNSFKIFGK